MPKNRTTMFARAFAIALAMTTAVALSGCTTDPLDAVIGAMTDGSTDKVVEAGADDADSTIDPADIVDLPSDFPAEVPLLDGPITSATSIDMNGLGYWDLHVRTADSQAAMNTVRGDLVSAGFSEKSWTEAGALISGAFASDSYRVAVQSAKDIDGHMLLYTVTELG